MADRHNHYEAAFEAYLRNLRVPYIAVNESRRSLLPEGRSLKSLDFIVPSPGPTVWLIDVKGRRFPTGQKTIQYWTNWCTKEELESLEQWEQMFGPSFRGLLVFAYWIVGQRKPLPEEQIFFFREQMYAFLGIPLLDYQASSRQRSRRWQTVTIPVSEFRSRTHPVHEFLGRSWPPGLLLPTASSPSGADCSANSEQATADFL
ncbi:MAG: HYExAFE family protein [Thermoguttaceae bacterium]|nr:HYExAFE family protein [Thermoguttaceae bacterium]MDW8037744.1 HYExAFE family protein [Thermoguttaceae bacterium]